MFACVSGIKAALFARVERPGGRALHVVDAGELNAVLLVAAIEVLEALEVDPRVPHSIDEELRERVFYLYLYECSDAKPAVLVLVSVRAQ